MVKQDPVFDFEIGKYKGRGRIGLIALGMFIVWRTVIVIATTAWLLSAAPGAKRIWVGFLGVRSAPDFCTKNPQPDQRLNIGA
jgi:hypothetical protein